MYTIIDQNFVMLRGSERVYRVSILVDTAADIPEPLATWEPGSMCLVAADHTFKVLNNEREWV